jgi:hypothetical protein
MIVKTAHLLEGAGVLHAARTHVVGGCPFRPHELESNPSPASGQKAPAFWPTHHSAPLTVIVTATSLPGARPLVVRVRENRPPACCSYLMRPSAEAVALAMICEAYDASIRCGAHER